MTLRSPSRPQTAGPHWPARRAHVARPGHLARARRIGASSRSFVITSARPVVGRDLLDAAA